MNETSTSSPTSTPDPLAGSGLVVVDKPAGMTSHDVVGRLRRIFGTRKVGHAGTLDPMATGVLVVGIERGTKFLAHMVAATKAYDATIRFGFATDTDDADGAPIISSEAISEKSPPSSFFSGIVYPRWRGFGGCRGI